MANHDFQAYADILAAIVILLAVSAFVGYVLGQLAGLFGYIARSLNDWEDVY